MTRTAPYGGQKRIASKDTKSYVRLKHRFERLNTLLKHYAIEIDTLLSVDDAISSMRGNEIVRTLTIFTVLCLPATILGSIWGSNFEWLPFKDKPFGFVYLILTIFVITGFLSILFWKKGWTGDLIIAQKSKKERKQHLRIQNELPHHTELQHNVEHELPPRQQRKTKHKQMNVASKEYDTIDELPKRSQRHK